MILDVLHVYERASGQLLNSQKSSIFFSNNTPMRLRLRMSQSLGVEKIGGQEMYLGLLSSIGQRKRDLFSSIRDKVERLIEGWEGKLLSKVGKKMLLKTVALTMPSYAMQCFKLPVSLCKEINGLLGRFWWKSTKERCGIHWVRWSHLAEKEKEKENENGGLNFQDLVEFNLAMLAKQGWRMISNERTLMSRMYKSKYFPNGSFLDAKLGSRPSWGWRSILEARNVLKHGMRWRVGSGRSIRVWSDPWLPNPITFKVQSVCPIGQDMGMRVNELICDVTKNWDKGMVSSLFNNSDASAILSLPISTIGVEDRLVWHYTKDGEYSVASGYMTANRLSRNGIGRGGCEGETSQAGDKGRWLKIWKTKAPNKVKHFLWQCIRDILHVGSNLRKCIRNLDAQVVVFVEVSTLFFANELSILSFCYVPRACNRVADAILKFALSIEHPCWWLYDPPSWLLTDIEEDL